MWIASPALPAWVIDHIGFAKSSEWLALVPRRQAILAPTAPNVPPAFAGPSTEFALVSKIVLMGRSRVTR